MEQKMAGFKEKVSITKRNRLDGMLVSESEDGNLVLTTTNSNK